jgi:beta-galactosidase
VAVTDAQGRVVPEAGNLVSFELSGPGRILGVGNGDPACHEPDTLVARPAPRSVLLDTWRIKEVPDTKDRPETAKDYSVRNWRRVDVRADLGPLAPGGCAVFRKHFEPSDATLSAASVSLIFGAIHDDGWVYVNGRFVGEAHGAPTLPAFEIGKFIEPGDNTLAVVVKTHGELGGLNNDVWLVIQDAPAPAHWQRSVFNGLAQVIVQSGTQPGELKLAARSQDLAPATLTLAARACALPPAVP